MADEDQIEYLGGAAEVLRYFQERSDDIEKVIIPRGQKAIFRDEDGRESHYPAGMVVFLCEGDHFLVHPEDTPAILNDGILERMQIPTEHGD